MSSRRVLETLRVSDSDSDSEGSPEKKPEPTIRSVGEQALGRDSGVLALPPRTQPATVASSTPVPPTPVGGPSSSTSDTKQPSTTSSPPPPASVTPSLRPAATQSVQRHVPTRPAVAASKSSLEKAAANVIPTKKKPPPPLLTKSLIRSIPLPASRPSSKETTPTSASAPFNPAKRRFPASQRKSSDSDTSSSDDDVLVRAPMATPPQQQPCKPSIPECSNAPTTEQAKMNGVSTLCALHGDLASEPKIEINETVSLENALVTAPQVNATFTVTSTPPSTNEATISDVVNEPLSPPVPNESDGEEEEDPFAPTSNKFATTMRPDSTPHQDVLPRNVSPSDAPSTILPLQDADCSSVASTSILVGPTDSILLRSPLGQMRPLSAARALRTSNCVTLVLPPEDVISAPASLVRLGEGAEPPASSDGSIPCTSSFETPLRNRQGEPSAHQNTPFGWSHQRYARKTNDDFEHQGYITPNVVPSPACIASPAHSQGRHNYVTRVDHCHNNAAGATIPMPKMFVARRHAWEDYEEPSMRPSSAPHTHTDPVSEHSSDEEEEDGPRLAHFDSPRRGGRRTSPETAGKSLSPSGHYGGGEHERDSAQGPYESVKFASPAADHSGPMLNYLDRNPSDSPPSPQQQQDQLSGDRYHHPTFEEEEPSAILSWENGLLTSSPPDGSLLGGLQEKPQCSNAAIFQEDDGFQSPLLRFDHLSHPSVPETAPIEALPLFDSPLKKKRSARDVDIPHSNCDLATNVEGGDSGTVSPEKALKRGANTAVNTSTNSSSDDDASPKPPPKTFIIFDDGLASDEAFFSADARPTALTTALTNHIDPHGIRAATQKKLIKSTVDKQLKKQQRLWVKNGFKSVRDPYSLEGELAGKASEIDDLNERQSESPPSEAPAPIPSNWKERVTFTNDIALEKIKQEDKERRIREGGLVERLIASTTSSYAAPFQQLGAAPHKQFIAGATHIDSPPTEASNPPEMLPPTGGSLIHFAPHKLKVCSNENLRPRDISPGPLFEPPVPSKGFFDEVGSSSRTSSRLYYNTRGEMPFHNGSPPRFQDSVPRPSREQQRLPVAGSLGRKLTSESSSRATSSSVPRPSRVIPSPSFDVSEITISTLNPLLTPSTQQQHAFLPTPLPPTIGPSLPAATSGWSQQNVSLSHAVQQRDAMQLHHHQQHRSIFARSEFSSDEAPGSLSGRGTSQGGLLQPVSGIATGLGGGGSGSVPRRREHRTIMAPF